MKVKRFALFGAQLGSNPDMLAKDRGPQIREGAREGGSS